MGRPRPVFAPVDPDPTPADLCRDGCLSLDDAARYCGLTEDLFRSAVLPHVRTVRIGSKRVVVPKGELVRFLAERLTAGVTR